MPKVPAILLYPGDWLRDSVAGCSIAAQGLWLRMMFIGHDSGRYGYLVNKDGSPIPPGSIAQRCGVTLAQYEALLAELDSVSVPSRTPSGILFSRRMVRDAALRRKEAEKKRKQRCPDDVPEMSSDSSSSSASSNSFEREFFELVRDEYPKKSGEEAAWQVWNELRPDEDLRAKIMAAVRQQRGSRQWLQEGVRYVPELANWLTGKRWNDRLAADHPELNPKKPPGKPRTKAEQQKERIQEFFDNDLERGRKTT